MESGRLSQRIKGEFEGAEKRKRKKKKGKGLYSPQSEELVHSNGGGG